MSKNVQSDNHEPAKQAILRLRLAPSDARYGGGLVAGAKVVEVIGDLATELAIRDAGEEGLSVAYEQVEFLAPLFSGDFIEARAGITGVGETSRQFEAEVHKVIAAGPGDEAAVLREPILVGRAKGTLVVGMSVERTAEIERGAET
jgi:3-aminobutyryl-CoA ammonia-lyase